MKPRLLREGVNFSSREREHASIGGGSPSLIEAPISLGMSNVNLPRTLWLPHHHPHAVVREQV